MSEISLPDPSWTVAALSALAHEHRLAAFRLLIEAGPAGLNAGELATTIALAPSSLAFHLQALLHAGLINQRRASRHVIYAADFSAMNGLVGYLVQNCCGRDVGCTPGCDPIPDARRWEQKSA
jgi:DNA-binding transcriptional ArsR family regulator